MSVTFDFAVALDSAPGEILVKPPNLSNFHQPTDSLPDIISQKCPNHPLARAGIPERLFGKDKHPMKRKASISHDEAKVRELRDNPDFAAEYLKAALEDADEPNVLLIALRRIAEAGRHRQSSQSRRHRAREPLSRLVRARKPSTLHPRRRDQGGRFEAHGRTGAVILSYERRRSCFAVQKGILRWEFLLGARNSAASG
jgi:DNA-binding phage protein